MNISQQNLIDELEAWSSLSLRLNMKELLEFAKKSDISLIQLDIIMLVDQEPNCDLTSICKHLVLTHSAASQMVDRLQKAGFLYRQESSQDRRVKFVRLTEQGKQTAKDCFQKRRESLAKLIYQIQPEETELITMVLKRLNEIFADYTEI